MPESGTRSRGALAGVSAVAGCVWLLVDLWRVWTPSLITVFGQAASTPPEVIGGFAIGCMALPLLLVAVLRTRLTGPAAMLALLAVAAVARVLVAVPLDAQARLYSATVGVVAASTWLCVATVVLGEAVLGGFATGVALASTSHAALGTLGAVWRRDAWGWAELVLLLLLLMATAPAASGPAGPTRTTARLAWLLFPSLLLAGIVLADIGRASATEERFGPLLAVLGCWLAVLALALPRRGGAFVGAALVLVPVVLGLFVWTHDGGRPVPGSAPLLLVGMPALVLCLRRLDSPRPAGGGAGPARAAAGGAVVWVLLLFGFYAGYDLGYTAAWLVPLVALAIVLVAATGPAGHGPRPRVTPRWTVMAAAAAVVSVVLAWAGPAATLRGPGDAAGSRSGVGSLRVMAWNLRMGYGMDGRFDARQVAARILRSGAQVVLLSEIDRGWLLNGGQDQLRVLARLTGMHAVFGPAADPVWGDAILTRLPVSAVARHHYAAYGSLTGAEALSATVRWRGRPLRVVSTHFQPTGDVVDQTTGQARELAHLMRAAARRWPDVVVGGDLNTTPGSAAWRTLVATGFRDALAAARPLPTNPADAPDLQLDHILVTGGLRPAHPMAPRSLLSDHLPVLVELRPVGAG